jgi:hypothetical protein
MDQTLIVYRARCTTAAPSYSHNHILLENSLTVCRYFPPKLLPRFGSFQDGGLQYNNPVRPGIREGLRIWKGASFDVVLSIGTGFQNEKTSPIIPNFRNIFKDGFLLRLYRASMSSLSMDGQRNWEDHWHGLPDDVKGRHFRLNLPLSHKEPKLDDVDAMNSLEDDVQSYLGDIQGLSRALMAASFFFELDEKMVFDGGVWKCRGSILCRSPDSQALTKRITAEYPLARFVLGKGIYLGLLLEEDICNNCGRFQKTVAFDIQHHSEIIDLRLDFNRLLRSSISAFPRHMNWFEEQQLMQASFGRPDHKEIDCAKSSYQCSCRAQRRSLPMLISDSPKRSSSSQASKRRSKRRKTSTNS